MKKLLQLAVLTLGLASSAQAQIHVAPGSARAIEAQKAMPDQERARTPSNAPAKPRRVLVECRDGSMHIAQVCRRHGGIARSRKPG
jgi:hypothetical protein